MRTYKSPACPEGGPRHVVCTHESIEKDPSTSMTQTRSLPRLLVGLLAPVAWSWPVANLTLPSDYNFAPMMTEQQDALSLPHIAARGSPVSSAARALGPP